MPKQSFGSTDPDRVSAAAEELRDRTMSFERIPSPTPWLFGAAVVATVLALVMLLFAYRRPIVIFLRQIGL